MEMVGMDWVVANTEVEVGVREAKKEVAMGLEMEAMD